MKLNSQKDLDKLRHVPIDGQKRMLIVEDSDHIVKLLKGIFKNKYIVETAANGLEGLKKTSLQNFDIIISDISMPVMSGIEFYSEVAKHDPDIGRHFLFYSAYTGEHIDFLKKFDLRHITKPIPIKKIRRTVEDMLKTYKSEITSYQKMNDRICSLLVSNHSLACLYIDCSNMNNIEGHFGKKIYLDVLRKIHNLLSDIKGKHLRQDDIIVSNGVAGDEFIVFLAKKRYDRDFCPTDLVGICNRITALINNNINPVTIPYLRGRPKIAVGYAVIIHNPLIRDERLINKLIEDAKLMSTYQEFKRQMRNKEKLQELILKESIKTVFQPVVDFTNNEIIGYEALTRGPEGTEYEYPYILFDVAEETDLLFELDRLCRKKAFQNARGINPKYKLFLNCQPSAVLDPEFRDSYLKSLLQDSKINPFNVVLEVTEREAVEDYDLFKEAATYYSDIGFAIAVDDTGAGYSSLETVVELKPKYIKLDISIIREIDKNILKQELIKAIVGLSKKMHSIVIAEGIETEEELNTLKEIGINFGQGFLFGKPAPPFPDICR